MRVVECGAGLGLDHDFVVPWWEEQPVDLETQFEREGEEGR